MLVCKAQILIVLRFIRKLSKHFVRNANFFSDENYRSDQIKFFVRLLRVIFHNIIVSYRVLKVRASSEIKIQNENI